MTLPTHTSVVVVLGLPASCVEMAKSSSKGSMGKQDKSGSSSKNSAGKKDKSTAASSSITKRKHARAESHSQEGRRHHVLVEKLQGTLPKAAESAREKKRKKRSAQSAVLGAVSGMAQSLEELMQASDARVRTSAATHAQDGGVSLTSKKRCVGVCSNRP